MSEEKKSEVIKIPLIPPGKELTVKIDSVFVRRLEDLFYNVIPFENEEHFNNCIKEIKEGSLKDPMSHYVYTIFYLIELLSEAAQKKISLKIRTLTQEPGSL